MADVQFERQIVSGSLAPDKVHHWHWNNVPNNRVPALGVDVKMDPFPSTEHDEGDYAAVEIVRIEHRNVYKGSLKAGFENELHFWVKNTGSRFASYRVHLAMIGE